MISKEEIEHLKDLARVEFGKAETEKLAKDLGDILGYVETLKEADIANVSETTHALEGVKNVMRSDASSSEALAKEDYGLAKALIDAFPEKHDVGHGTYLKVKPIL